MKFTKKIKKTNIKSRPLKIGLILFLSFILLAGLITFNSQKELKEIFSAIEGSMQADLRSSTNDLFNCGGRDDCDDDFDDIYDGPQHKYLAQAYDKFGFPLAAIKYNWWQDDTEDLIKFRDFDDMSVIRDKSETENGDIDQQIYVQTNEDNLQNGEATVNVLAYTDDESLGKDQSVDVTLFFCLNTWPNITTFPFSDSDNPQDNPYTNFKTYYCKDRGNIVNPNDDYPALKIVERSSETNTDFLCSGGGGNSLKCTSDYSIEFNGGLWNRELLAWPLSSPDAVAMTEAGKIFATQGDRWAYLDGAVSSGVLGIDATPYEPWPQIGGEPLKPTAIATDSDNRLFVISGNSYTVYNGGTWTPLSSLAADEWPSDVQFPTEIAEWTEGSFRYRLVLKDNIYRIYTEGNSCNADLRCETPGGRIWGRCETSSDCSWGERFSLFTSKDWPSSEKDWQKNVRFSIKTIALRKTSPSKILTTSSCETAGGICLLKEFLLIANPACSDGIDNDSDGTCDWQDNLCGAGIPRDLDCVGPDDNSESGTCDDGIDDDNDGSIDYPADFSCDSYSDIEEEGCDSNRDCCDNFDNDNDGLIDQQDSGCTSRSDNNESNACNDGIDNDSDGFIDIADAGCIDFDDDDEKGFSQCDDGKDNDGDTYIDYRDADSDGLPDIDSDPECTGPGDDNESF